MKLFLSFLLLCTASLTASVFAFEIPADSVFYHPTIGEYRKTIEQPSSASDHGIEIANAIEAVNQNGGGILTINAVDGNNIYNIVTEVQIKSNVHIRVSPNVVFKTNKGAKATLFSAGKKGNQRISNFSFTCTDDEQYFTFDFSNRIAGEKDGGAIALSLGATENFHVANFKVLDNFTPYSCVTVNLLEYTVDGQTKYLFSRYGIVENLDTYTGHYGYGTVQCQAAFKVLYRNLRGEGGAALRLETGAICKANKADRTVRIDSVYAQNIACRNGQSAVTLSPHTVNNGTVFIDNVLAESCECGAVVAAGFLSAKKGQKDEDGNAIDGYVYGYFEKESIISNLRVVYGTNAQLRGQRRLFVPCSQQYLISESKNPDQESYNGPTVAAIVYYAKAGTDRDKGYYTVQTPNLLMEDFPVVDGKIENKEYVASTKEYNKDCGSTNIDKRNTTKKKAVANRTDQQLEIRGGLGYWIEIYNLSGKLVRSVMRIDSDVCRIPYSELDGRFYILKLRNEAAIITEKVFL